jgi:hypothetical protein
MAFGQQTGPPATGRQIQELLQLLHDAGHVDFRDARGPMGFSQRQAGGKFTRDEAEAFIARLQEAEALRSEESAAPVPTTPPANRHAVAPTPRRTALSAIATPQLADELRRRGWTVTEP